MPRKERDKPFKLKFTGVTRGYRGIYTNGFDSKEKALKRFAHLESIEGCNPKWIKFDGHESELEKVE